MKWIYKYRKWIFVAVVLVVIVLLAPQLSRLSPQDILSYTPASPFLAALVFIGIYCAKSVVMVIPTYGLYIAGGMLLPAGWAILVAYIGLAGEMSLGFLLGRWLGREKVAELVEKYPKAKRFVAFLSNNSSAVCFATRILPMPYPVDLGSMVFGASGMAFWKHLVFSLLGFSAVMIPLTLAGGAIDDPLSARFIVPLAISVGLCILLFVAYLVWQKKSKTAEKAGEKEENKAED